MRKLLWAVSMLAALTLSGCGYNEFQTKDEQVNSAWGEGLNQYQPRAQPFHQGGAGLQHPRAPVPHQPHRDDVRVQAEGIVHGRGREVDLAPAESRLRPEARATGTGSGSRARAGEVTQKP